MDFGKLFEIFVVILLTSSGQLLLRFVMKGVDLTGGVDQLMSFVFKTPLLWVALALYGLSTLLWIRVLSRFPVSSVYPMVALGYVLVTLGGAFFLGEKVPTQGWVALAVICLGVFLLATAPWQNPI